MKTTDFLDAVKKRLDLSTDYQLAKKLGWRTQRLSMYRHTNRELDDDACMQIAELLEVPGAYVMAEIASERAKSAAAKREWKKAAAYLKKGMAAMLLAGVVGASQFAAPVANASSGLRTERVIDYAQWRDRRRRRDAKGTGPGPDPNGQRRDVPPGDLFRRQSKRPRRARRELAQPIPPAAATRSSPKTTRPASQIDDAPHHAMPAA